MIKELVVDNFAGGGGASTGIEIAMGRSVDIAINHDPDAIAMHRANHPSTKHYCEDVWQVDPIEACNGNPVALAWFSPDCKHHSRAKGGKPVDKNIRGLAWVAVRWAKKVKPRVIMLENVEEFMDWGPLDENNRPDHNHKGETFNEFISELEKLGYHIEHRILRACDYGAPTIRKRFFLIARSDGEPIIWPEPTHGDPTSEAVLSGQLKPWVPVSDVIDFSLPCPSIFDSSEEIFEKFGIRAVRPLKEKTMRRIFRGLKKYVIDNPTPFIVQVNHNGDTFRGQGIDEPLDTITSKHGTGVVMPVMLRNNENAVGTDPKDPLGTITTGGHHMLIAPSMIQYHDEMDSTGVRGQRVEEPIKTVDTSNRYGLVSTFITQFNNNSVGQSVEEPLNTITAQAGHYAEVNAFLVKYYSGEDNNASVTEPMHTITAKDRMGLVTVNKENYQIVDIGLRMLTPRELFNAQGFPKDYTIDVDADGKVYPKSKQVARCGNAVCPPIPTALVRANLPELCEMKKGA